MKRRKPNAFYRKPAVVLGLAGMTLQLSSTALARDAAQAPNQAETASAPLVEEVVVTARKRAENLQDTPIAISAFSAEGIEARGIQATDALASVTPNLTLQNNPAFGGSGNNASIYIRGVGQQDFLPTVDPGVGVYVDGVYIARSVGSILDLLDFEQIEVLRGPQGTLFGRNTIGGAISITSKQPTETTEGSASLLYGTDSQVIAKASLNGKLAEGLTARATVGSFNRDGYVTRPFDGKDLGDSDRIAGRLAIRAEASETLNFVLAVDATRARENGPPMTLLGAAYGFTRAAPPFVDINNVLANLAAGGGPVPCTSIANPNTAVPGCFDDRYVVGKDRNLGTAPSYSNSDIFGASLVSTLDASDDITLKAITAYRDLDGEFSRDGDGSPITIAQFADTLQQRQFSQELQVLGKSFDDRMNWIVGGYYFRETGDNENLLDFTVSRFRSGGAFENKSYAAFTQATLDLSDAFSLTAGVRYTRDSKSFTPEQVIFENKVSFLPPFDAPFFAAGTPILPNVTATREYSKVTPMVNLSFKPVADLLTYVTFSRGFKSGGFTQRVFPPIVFPYTTNESDPEKQIPGFDPEEVDAYELGFKYTSPSGTFRLNAAAFLNDYSDAQIQVFTSVGPVFRNAASADVKGFEAELQLRPGDGWFAEAAVGYADASYNDIDPTTFVSPDNEFERVSKWTLSAGLQKRFEFDAAGSLTPRLDWSYRSKFFNDTFNTPQIAQSGYHLVDANITWRNASDNLSIAAAVKNIFDESYLLSGVYGDAFQVYEGIYNRGREASVAVAVKF